ncbi:hypothetical protein AVEN_198358-1 [Araneus ventricosus]|uniref:Uncharacterized protein n=1 Tax=Araneus ventricosus TaxID=182803 RepID=A0A4Y2WF76_ARAVE|nr:hypothetical protein AVEN_71752-1 [Araneus ventricosus]GBO35769.1 hypothetical protein AVEN_111134-1 [Araneus ventricosus]GBO35869.1 hypothetical protein AVEN_113785-1 [Araneus ventricosus]GBO35875.1 hypothetical protein AVEN_198358-1 [Araneus ventricosus]
MVLRSPPGVRAPQVAHLCSRAPRGTCTTGLAPLLQSTPGIRVPQVGHLCSSAPQWYVYHRLGTSAPEHPRGTCTTGWVPLLQSTPGVRLPQVGHLCSRATPGVRVPQVGHLCSKATPGVRVPQIKHLCSRAIWRKQSIASGSSQSFTVTAADGRNEFNLVARGANGQFGTLRWAVSKTY